MLIFWLGSFSQLWLRRCGPDTSLATRQLLRPIPPMSRPDSLSGEERRLLPFSQCRHRNRSADRKTWFSSSIPFAMNAVKMFIVVAVRLFGSGVHFAQGDAALAGHAGA